MHEARYRVILPQHYTRLIALHASEIIDAFIFAAAPIGKISIGLGHRSTGQQVIQAAAVRSPRNCCTLDACHQVIALRPQ
jgi:hypothetical protein